MDTFAFGMRRNRLFRALGPNPLVRRSDRIQALSLLRHPAAARLSAVRAMGPCDQQSRGGR